jgi:hypothetical protein
MRTEKLHTTRTRIYPPDIVPLLDLTSPHAVLHIRKSLVFEQSQQAQTEDKNLPGFMFNRGRIPTAESNAPATIDNLTIGQLQLDLTTQHLDGHQFNDSVLQELNRLCDEITPWNQGWTDAYRIEIFHTMWIGQLELNPDDLIDIRARDLLRTGLSKDTSSKGTRAAHARGLTFKITTEISDPELRELGVQIPDEEFKLEPRAGTLSREQKWFSTSNLRSENHLRLLEELERAYRN